MITHADKTQENTLPAGRRESQPMASGVALMKAGGESAIQLMDNRPAAVVQRQRQVMADNSPQAVRLKAIQKMADSSPRVQHSNNAVKSTAGTHFRQLFRETVNSAQAPALPTALPVVQRNKFYNDGIRALGDERPKAKPFQMAATQFDAAYDIHQYRNEILEYAGRCEASGQIPVIELRMYDAAFQTSVQKYLEAARVQLGVILTGQTFDLACSILRDETQEPANIEGRVTGEIMEALASLAEWLRTATDLSMGEDEESRGRFARGDRDLKARKMAALDHPNAKMLAGKMMIPLEEAMHFATLGIGELTQIYDGSSAERYSLHHRLLAKTLLLNKEKPFRPAGAHAGAGVRQAAAPTAEHKAGAGVAVAEERGPEALAAAEAAVPAAGRRLRSNSLVAPDSVTFTNLVTGDEAQTLQSTLQACQAAFRKGVSQVYLIVEELGIDRYPRAKNLIVALEGRSYIPDVIGRISGRQEAGQPGVQQSGIMLNEPGPDIPSRLKIKVTRPVGAGGSIAADAPGELWTYTEWYQQMVGQNLDEADEFKSIYMLSYLEHLAKNWPSRIVDIRNIDPESFRHIHKHYRSLYARAIAHH
ncbi:MAG: hypothetical protein KDD10_28725 [Phaeodactylibacter sp.]|nr:hypothetical protein [Phaeodactylibacter sp.]MCB9296415.1 hypothetical protein [Lewinellaceae bacterium]